MTPMLITPTLHFHGQCEEAIALYGQAFNLRTSFILRYSDAEQRDWDIPLTEKQQRYVYHSEGYIGEQRIMLADEIEPDPTGSRSLFLTVTFETADQVKQAYGVLTEEGSIIQPLRSTTYSSCMASVTDKFGFRWGLMTELAQPCSE
jgi:PhnB protein